MRGEALNNKLIFFVLLLSMVSAGCNKSDLVIHVDEAVIVESQRDVIDVSEPEIAEEEGDGAIYQFHDESVKEEVERYFNRTTDQLTEIDLKTLSQVNSLVVVETVETLKDLPNLFPNLRYLKITCSDSMPVTDWNILEDMESLRALTLSAKNTDNLEFVKNLPYLEISYPDNESLSEQNNLAFFSVLGMDFINSNIDGSPLKLIRISDDNGIYEMVLTDAVYQAEFFSSQERKIFVSQHNGDNFVCRNILDGTNIIGDFASNRLHIRDVNFDGKDDILVDNGHFGNQGLVTYTCFLNTGGAYEKNESFTDISNPAIDVKNEKILSVWRNWAASHSWAMYVYDGTDYIMADCLTEETITSYIEGTDLNEDVWQYTIEKRVKNEMEVIEIFTTQDYTDEQIREMVYDENSYWGLSSDKWRTLFNNGKMTDFSIYGSSYIDDTILDIISRE